MKLGERIQLDPSVDCNSLGLDNAQKIICVALQEYGMIFVENTGPWNNLVYAEQLINKSVSWTNVFSSIIINIPLNRLRIVAPIYPYQTDDTIPPSTPTALASTFISSTQINLSWSASTDNVAVAGYKIYRNGTQIAITSNTNYSDTGLSPSTTYTYSVSAYDAAGNNSNRSGSVSVSTQAAPDTQAPTVPNNLTATTISSTQINLSWTASIDNVGVSGYKVFRNGLQIATTSNTNYSDTGLSPLTTYSYTVSAFDAAGNVSAQSAVISAMTQVSVPPSTTVYEDAEDGTIKGWDVYDNDPAGANITNVYDNDRMSRVIQLTGSGWDNGYRLRKDDWSAWNNSTQFIIEWSMKYSEYFNVYIDVETTAGHRYLYYTPDNYNALGTSEYVHHGLGSGIIDGKWHTFVRDLLADLQEAQPGVTILEVNGFLIRGSGRVDDIKLSNKVPVTDTQAPTVPTNLQATAISSSQINLSWTASIDNVGVTGYKVFRNGVQIATTSNTNYSDTGLSPLTTYSYTVSAFDAAGNVSAQSAQASATTQSTIYNLTVRAKGSDASGWPNMEIWIDGVKVVNTTVNSTSYTDYNFSISSNPKKIDVVFTNDYYDSATGADRNLYVDYIIVTGKTIQAEDPSVILDKGSGSAAFDGINTILGQEGILWDAALRFNN
jgi:chitodextrinase